MANSVETLPAADRLTRSWRWPDLPRIVLRFVRRKPLGAIGGVIVLTLLVMAVFADRIAPYEYDQSIRGARSRPPSAQFWMGTDNLSRDVWSRVVYGARISITVGFATVGLATLIATAVGVSSAYLGGGYDILIQRVVDAWMSFPALVVVLSLMAALGPGIPNLILALSIIGAANASRVIRGATLSVMANPYVEAARALGAGHLRIMLRYILPNVAATVIILATIGLGVAILAESALSFLGFGVPPPHPSWGGMLSGSGRTYMYQAPWIAVWPGAAISTAVFGFNMLGDALRDVLDPRLRGSGRSTRRTRPSPYSARGATGPCRPMEPWGSGPKFRPGHCTESRAPRGPTIGLARYARCSERVGFSVRTGRAGGRSAGPPAPPSAAVWPVVGLSGAGLLLSLYLTATKLAGSTALFCQPSGGCDVVQSSHYSVLIGIPTAAWGAALYLLVGSLALQGLSPGRWRAALLLSVAGLSFSAYLTYIELFVLRALCAYCLGAAAIGLVLFVVLALRPPAAAGRRSPVSPRRLVPAAVVVAVATIMVGAAAFRADDPGTASPYQRDLARHLSATGAIMYGAYW